VLDTGILPNDELAGQLVDGYDFVGPDDPDAPAPTYLSAYDGDGWDASPVDPGDWTSRGLCYRNSPGSRSSWHGTFVAGQVAAKADNGAGVVGVAPGVKVQPVRVLGRCGGWDSDIIAGILWASGETVSGVPVNQTPSQVINLSLGYTYGSSADRAAACVPYSSAASIAQGNGSVLIAAAGNDGSNADWAVPASCSGFLSVGATSSRGFSALYSNIGSTVDISAPGGDTFVEGATDSILGLGNTGTTGASTNNYVRREGTSAAAPQVSAAAALFYSLGITNPTDVTTALKSSVSTFRYRSATYAKKKLRIGGRDYYVDLNCWGHRWCGSGILDLSKAQYPLGEASFTGAPIIGEPLEVVPPPYVGNGPLAYEWSGGDGYAGPGAPPGANFIPDPRASSYYTPLRQDMGKQITVSVRPGTPDRWNPFSQFSKTVTSDPVLDGPSVQLSGLGKEKYGSGDVALVYSPDVASGPIEIRRGDHTVMAVGTLVDHQASIPVPGLTWSAGSYAVRAAFLGDGTTNPASSPGAWVAVSKATSAATTSLASSVKRTSHARLKVTVKVAGDTHPSGAIKIYDGSKTLATSYMYASNAGTRTFTLPRLKAGKHWIRVYYYGNSNIVGKYSTYKTIVSK
ncbi:MAG: S8 family serine peptidase, partial [Aeromicrobium sp.]